LLLFQTPNRKEWQQEQFKQTCRGGCNVTRGANNTFIGTGDAVAENESAVLPTTTKNP
jgi:hypothetical protein